MTGLRLIALSVTREEELLAAIEGFRRDAYPFVQEYLVQEVLAKTPPDFARYLLETSILNRFNAELCDVLHHAGAEPADPADQTTGRQFIDWLKKTHLFVSPLDERGRWLRYHHLFQQLLQNPHPVGADERSDDHRIRHAPGGAARGDGTGDYIFRPWITFSISLMSLLTCFSLATYCFLCLTLSITSFDLSDGFGPMYLNLTLLFSRYARYRYSL